MKKTLKSALALGLAVIMTAGCMTGISASAKKEKNKATKTTAKVTTAKATCTAAGKVNVKFKGMVTYAEDLSVTVTDETQNELETTVSKKNRGMMVIKIAGMVKGQKYNISISGIRKKGETEYGNVNCTFTAKRLKTTCKAKKITKKVTVKKKNTIIIKCKSNVKFKDATVTVSDQNGDKYEAKLVGKSKGNIKVSIRGLKKASTYTITITGVKTKKELNYGSITTKFTTK